MSWFRGDRRRVGRAKAEDLLGFVRVIVEIVGRKETRIWNLARSQRDAVREAVDGVADVAASRWGLLLRRHYVLEWDVFKAV